MALPRRFLERDEVVLEMLDSTGDDRDDYFAGSDDSDGDDGCTGEWLLVLRSASCCRCSRR